MKIIIKIMPKQKIIYFCYILLSSISVIYLFKLHINTSASMPMGIYREVSQPITKYSLVAVCLPQNIALFGKQQGYINAGNCFGNTEAVLKQVVAIEEDFVQVTHQGVFINNQLLPHSKVLLHDKKLRPLTSQINQRKQLLKNEIWLYGTSSEKSWDSRYYGAINIFNVRAVVKPVWVFNNS